MCVNRFHNSTFTQFDFFIGKKGVSSYPKWTCSAFRVTVSQITGSSVELFLNVSFTFSGGHSISFFVCKAKRCSSNHREAHGLIFLTRTKTNFRPLIGSIDTKIVRFHVTKTSNFHQKMVAKCLCLIELGGAAHFGCKPLGLLGREDHHELSPQRTEFVHIDSVVQTSRPPLLCLFDLVRFVDQEEPEPENPGDENYFLVLIASSSQHQQGLCCVVHRCVIAWLFQPPNANCCCVGARLQNFHKDTEQSHVIEVGRQSCKVKICR